METEGKGNNAEVEASAQAKGEPKVGMKAGRAIEGKGGSKTFAPGTAKLLPKLERELERIKRASVEDGPNAVADHSYNFTMTAFNLAGWDFKERGGGKWKEYPRQIEKDCPEMRYLQISTSYSKHGASDLDDPAFGDVRVSGVAKYTMDPAWPDGIPPNATFLPDFEMSFWPKADIHGQSVQMIEVFEAVTTFWRTRLGS